MSDESTILISGTGGPAHTQLEQYPGGDGKAQVVTECLANWCPMLVWLRALNVAGSIAVFLLGCIIPFVWYVTWLIG